VGDDDARVVDRAPGTRAVHIPEGTIEEDPRLEAGEPGKVLDEEPSRVGKDQPRALRRDLLVADDHLVGGGVVLGFLAGAEGIRARALLAVFPELQVPHDPRERAVGDGMALVVEDLPDPLHVAPAKGEGLADRR